MNLKERIPSAKDREKKWIAFYFTDEEDLFIISDDGLIFFIDPKTGEFRDKEPVLLSKQFQVNLLVDSRFEQTTNMIVLRNQAAQFFWIKNIAQGLQVNKFSSSSELEELAGLDESTIADYLIIPAEKSGSS